MLQVHYKSKKDLKAAIGQTLRYSETSIFGNEFKSDGKFCAADGSPARKWFAEITMQHGLIFKVA